MTTFESILYAILHGLTWILPLDADLHSTLVPTFSQLSPLTQTGQAALGIGVTAALLVAFRHDWASMISSTLSMVVFRRKPMMMDERVPLFIAITVIPVAIIEPYLREQIPSSLTEPLSASLILAVGGVLLAFADYFSKKSKGVFDIGVLDALILAVFALSGAVRGLGLIWGLLVGAVFRNYRREAAAKYALFCAMPLSAVALARNWGEVSWGASAPSSNMNWISFVTAVVVSFVFALLAIGGLNKQATKQGPTGYVLYRIVLGVGAGLWIWLKA